MHALTRQAKLLATLKPQFKSVRFFFGDKTYNGHRRDSYDYTHWLQHCKTIKSVKAIHAQIIIGCYEQNPFLTTKLVSKYVEYGNSNMETARNVFDRLSVRDVFLWNVVIQAYANLGPFIQALNLYDEMRLSGVYPNRYTYPFVLKACGAMKDGETGKGVHGHVVKSGLDSDLFVVNALVSLYSKCKEIQESRKLFDEMLQRDNVSWNSMISGYTINECFMEAIVLLHAMLHDQTACEPDTATLVAILPACAQISAIQAGFWVHSYIIKSGMEVNAALGSGLISMYANCGRVNTARDVFDRINDKNVVVWGAMIRCYGMHSYADEALHMFRRLVQAGICPDSVIFLCLLSTCSHGGMVEKGREIYEKMKKYGVKRNEEHYACMVDLLGRAGLIDEAVEFIENMPVEAGKDVYGALLGACRIHNNIEVAKEVAEKLFVLDPDNAGRYVIMAKMYEDAGQWDNAARIRKLIREKKIRKRLGWSSVEVDCVHHTFGVDDESHPFTEQIFDTLHRLDSVREDGIEIICCEDNNNF